ncbi:Vacuolar protein sorting-associated protein ist1 [Gonapodya sp. JEL0774]|nr:Vacuolar protein sorting-associated protein ist1 [Gonapodya sp. JEL0774]
MATLSPALLTKLKTNLKLSVERLKLVHGKKMAQNKAAAREIGDLLRQGKRESARIRVENIIREDYFMEALEIMEIYCDVLLTRFGLIESLRRLDPAIEEAVHTVIYAAPRLADIRELMVIRDILIVKFGKDVGVLASENRYETVSTKIVTKLQLQTPPLSLVQSYLIQIAKQYGVPYDPDPVDDGLDEFGTDAVLLTEPNLVGLPTQTPSESAPTSSPAALSAPTRGAAAGQSKPAVTAKQTSGPTYPFNSAGSFEIGPAVGAGMPGARPGSGAGAGEYGGYSGGSTTGGSDPDYESLLRHRLTPIPPVIMSDGAGGTVYGTPLPMSMTMQQHQHFMMQQQMMMAGGATPHLGSLMPSYAATGVPFQSARPFGSPAGMNESLHPTMYQMEPMGHTSNPVSGVEEWRTVMQRSDMVKGTNKETSEVSQVIAEQDSTPPPPGVQSNSVAVQELRRRKHNPSDASQSSSTSAALTPCEATMEPVQANCPTTSPTLPAHFSVLFILHISVWLAAVSYLLFTRDPVTKFGSKTGRKECQGSGAEKLMERFGVFGASVLAVSRTVSSALLLLFLSALPSTATGRDTVPMLSLYLSSIAAIFSISASAPWRHLLFVFSIAGHASVVKAVARFMDGQFWGMATWIRVPVKFGLVVSWSGWHVGFFLHIVGIISHERYENTVVVADVVARIVLPLLILVTYTNQQSGALDEPRAQNEITMEDKIGTAMDGLLRSASIPKQVLEAFEAGDNAPKWSIRTHDTAAVVIVRIANYAVLEAKLESKGIESFFAKFKAVYASLGAERGVISIDVNPGTWAAVAGYCVGEVKEMSPSYAVDFAVELMNKMKETKVIMGAKGEMATSIELVIGVTTGSITVGETEGRVCAAGPPLDNACLAVQMTKHCGIFVDESTFEAIKDNPKFRMSGPEIIERKGDRAMTTYHVDLRLTTEEIEVLP